jgi:ELWxxDGT repeat protein
VLFAADDGVHGNELWRSDGTEAGTSLVADINDPGDSNPTQLTRLGSTVFFSATLDGFGTELWKTDGTAAGTTPITDINPGPGSSSPQLLTVVGDRLYFAADDGVHGTELWTSDGTAGGTHLVKDINPNGSGFAPTGSPFGQPGLFELVAVGDTLFFTADDGVSGIELWKSDGSADGTVLVRDINPGLADSAPAFLRDVGGTLFFIADDGTHGRELWTSDGTAAGTRMVTDINPNGGAFGTFTFFFSFADLGGELFFAADDGTHGLELWRSDGTAAGTALVDDINPHAGGSSSPTFLTRDGDRIVFQACEPETGCEVWQTSGLDTHRLADIVPGPQSSNPGHFTPSGGRVFFSATTPAAGTELWALTTCTGDCNDDAVVTINELIQGVRIALGEAPVAGCTAIDANGDGRVTIDELVRAVQAALTGCA